MSCFWMCAYSGFPATLLDSSGSLTKSYSSIDGCRDNALAGIVSDEDDDVGTALVRLGSTF